jgi:hypothetical protein
MAELCPGPLEGTPCPHHATLIQLTGRNGQRKRCPACADVRRIITKRTRAEKYRAELVGTIDQANNVTPERARFDQLAAIVDKHINLAN